MQIIKAEETAIPMIIPIDRPFFSATLISTEAACADKPAMFT